MLAGTEPESTLDMVQHETRPHDDQRGSRRDISGRGHVLAVDGLHYDPMQIRWSDVDRWIHFAIRADRLLGDRSASQRDSHAAQKSQAHGVSPRRRIATLDMFPHSSAGVKMSNLMEQAQA